ncbi:MAG: sigma-70 family RNA polymerase sigma factor [Eubacteriales bacterium]
MYDKNKRIAETQCSQTVCDGGGSSVMDIPDSSADVERLVINNCVCEYVVKLIDGLDHKYRDVITLKSMGFDYDEIANIMGISQTLARKRYSRARAMILETGGEMLYEYRSG